ncbi:Gp15 family bacteriophage protein [Caproicibacter sp.]|uniref:Gp15 family bacteriophage protein n=1 Tax=Caproicibacter sp. TaxID=2814884 RepID=UPI003988DF14
MTQRKSPPFAPAATARNNGFDSEYDYDLICASFAAAYGLRLRLPEIRMSWKEFSVLLTNLPAESQLARAIAIRTAEGEELNRLSAPQKKLRDDWYAWLNKRTTTAEKAAVGGQLQNTLKSMFYERRS